MKIQINALLIATLLSTPSPAATIDDVTVNPLPGPASCYAGTAGTDHVIFLKAKTSQADCDVIGGGSPCLARREFPGDGVNGRPISLLSALLQRPSVSGAGDLVAFSEPGFNVCFMATASEDTEGCLGRDFFGGVDPHSVSISPSGAALALTRVDAFSFQPTNQIFVLDSTTFVLLEPGYIVAVAGAGGDQLKVETVDFTVDGDYLIFDAQNPVTGLWGIYAVSRTTGITTTVVPPVAGLVIRNPQLAQTSDDYMVFDAQDASTFENTVIAANLLTGELSAVASTSLQGYPSYTGDDGAVVFNDFDNTVTSLASLDIQPLAGDRMTPAGVRSRWLNDGGVPEVYRRGTWNGTLLDPALCGVGLDSDGDGVADSSDNCIDAVNPDQLDTNGDTIGNACDGDFNGDCLTNLFDLVAFKAAFGTVGTPSDADFTGDNAVNLLDLVRFKALFGQPPGPSSSGVCQ